MVSTDKEYNMKQDFIKVYQFKITLEGIKPAIWRRIQVSENYTFWDLHVAVQDSMDWAGGDFDPEHFDPQEVDFDDPQERLKMAMKGIL